MHVHSSTAGRKEDVRDKVSRLTLKAEDDAERLFLADICRAILDNVPITIGDKTYDRAPRKPEALVPAGERCICGHTFGQHKKPKDSIPWDICSFPCRHCDCREYDEGIAARTGAGRGDSNVAEEVVSSASS